MSEIKPTPNPDGSVSLNDEYGTVARFDENGDILYTATLPVEGNGTMQVSATLPITDDDAMGRIFALLGVLADDDE